MEDAITNNKWTSTTWMVIILAILNILDFGTTHYAIKNMGVEEANPVLAYFIEVTGTVWSILWFKVSAFAFFYIWYALSKEFYEKFQQPLLQWTLVIMTAVYSLVVLSNFSLIITNTALLPF